MRKVVGLYCPDPDPYGGAKPLVEGLKTALGECPVVHLHGQTFQGEYLLPPEVIAAKVRGIWAKWLLPPAAGKRSAESPPASTSQPIPSKPELVMNLNVTNVTGNGNATAGAPQATASISQINQPALNEALGRLLPAMQTLPAGLSDDAHQELNRIILELQEHLQQPSQEPGRLRTLLAKVKGMTEYVNAGETIHRYAALALTALGVVL